jgi:hypothetical protein
MGALKKLSKIFGGATRLKAFWIWGFHEKEKVLVVRTLGFYLCLAGQIQLSQINISKAQNGASFFRI